MGKKRIVKVSETLEETPQTEELPAVVKEKKPEKQEVHLPGLKGGQRVKMVVAEPVPEAPSKEEIKVQKVAKKVKPARLRGKNYLAVRIKIDPTKLYPLPEAVKLAKETSLGKFDGSLEAHLVTTKTGLRGEIALPYFQGKTKKVKIADEAVLKKIESGKIDFDILVSTPAFMPNLVKYAKVLGPRGLMPNPKAGTITQDPQKAVAQFEKESFSFRTESNAPLIHSVFGKISQENEELEANLEALLDAIGPKNIKKAVIKATMGPGIKLAIDNL